MPVIIIVIFGSISLHLERTALTQFMEKEGKFYIYGIVRINYTTNGAQNLGPIFSPNKIGSVISFSVPNMKPNSYVSQVSNAGYNVSEYWTSWGIIAQINGSQSDSADLYIPYALALLSTNDYIANVTAGNWIMLPSFSLSHSPNHYSLEGKYGGVELSIPPPPPSALFSEFSLDFFSQSLFSDLWMMIPAPCNTRFVGLVSHPSILYLDYDDSFSLDWLSQPSSSSITAWLSRSDVISMKARENIAFSARSLLESLTEPLRSKYTGDLKLLLLHGGYTLLYSDEERVAAGFESDDDDDDDDDNDDDDDDDDDDSLIESKTVPYVVTDRLLHKLDDKSNNIMPFPKKLAGLHGNIKHFPRESKIDEVTKLLKTSIGASGTSHLTLKLEQIGVTGLVYLTIQLRPQSLLCSQHTVIVTIDSGCPPSKKLVVKREYSMQEFLYGEPKFPNGKSKVQVLDANYRPPSL